MPRREEWELRCEQAWQTALADLLQEIAMCNSFDVYHTPVVFDAFNYLLDVFNDDIEGAVRREEHDAALAVLGAVASHSLYVADDALHHSEGLSFLGALVFIIACEALRKAAAVVEVDDPDSVTVSRNIAKLFATVHKICDNSIGDVIPPGIGIACLADLQQPDCGFGGAIDLTPNILDTLSAWQRGLPSGVGASRTWIKLMQCIRCINTISQRNHVPESWYDVITALIDDEQYARAGDVFARHAFMIKKLRQPQGTSVAVHMPTPLTVAQRRVLMLRCVDWLPQDRVIAIVQELPKVLRPVRETPPWTAMDTPPLSLLGRWVSLDGDVFELRAVADEIRYTPVTMWGGAVVSTCDGSGGVARVMRSPDAADSVRTHPPLSYQCVNAHGQRLMWFTPVFRNTTVCACEALKVYSAGRGALVAQQPSPRESAASSGEPHAHAVEEPVVPLASPTQPPRRFFRDMTPVDAAVKALFTLLHADPGANFAANIEQTLQAVPGLREELAQKFEGACDVATCHPAALRAVLCAAEVDIAQFCLAQARARPCWNIGAVVASACADPQAPPPVADAVVDVFKTIAGHAPRRAGVAAEAVGRGVLAVLAGAAWAARSDFDGLWDWFNGYPNTNYTSAIHIVGTAVTFRHPALVGMTVVDVAYVDNDMHVDIALPSQEVAFPSAESLLDHRGFYTEVPRRGTIRLVLRSPAAAALEEEPKRGPTTITGFWSQEAYLDDAVHSIIGDETETTTVPCELWRRAAVDGLDVWGEQGLTVCMPAFEEMFTEWDWGGVQVAGSAFDLVLSIFPDQQYVPGGLASVGDNLGMLRPPPTACSLSPSATRFVVQMWNVVSQHLVTSPLLVPEKLDQWVLGGVDARALNLRGLRRAVASTLLEQYFQQRQVAWYHPPLDAAQVAAVQRSFGIFEEYLAAVQDAVSELQTRLDSGRVTLAQLKAVLKYRDLHSRNGIVLADGLDFGPVLAEASQTVRVCKVLEDDWRVRGASFRLDLSDLIRRQDNVELCTMRERVDAVRSMIPAEMFAASGRGAVDAPILRAHFRTCFPSATKLSDFHRHFELACRTLCNITMNDPIGKAVAGLQPEADAITGGDDEAGHERRLLLAVGVHEDVVRALLCGARPVRAMLHNLRPFRSLVDAPPEDALLLHPEFFTVEERALLLETDMNTLPLRKAESCADKIRALTHGCSPIALSIMSTILRCGHLVRFVQMNPEAQDIGFSSILSNAREGDGLFLAFLDSCNYVNPYVLASARYYHAFKGLPANTSLFMHPPLRCSQSCYTNSARQLVQVPGFWQALTCNLSGTENVQAVRDMLVKVTRMIDELDTIVNGKDASGEQLLDTCRAIAGVRAPASPELGAADGGATASDYSDAEVESYGVCPSTVSTTYALAALMVFDMQADGQPRFQCVCDNGMKIEGQAYHDLLYRATLRKDVSEVFEVFVAQAREVLRAFNFACRMYHGGHLEFRGRKMLFRHDEAGGVTAVLRGLQGYSPSTIAMEGILQRAAVVCPELAILKRTQLVWLSELIRRVALQQRDVPQDFNKLVRPWRDGRLPKHSSNANNMLRSERDRLAPVPASMDALAGHGSSADGRHNMDFIDPTTAVVRLSGLGVVDGDYALGLTTYVREGATPAYLVPVHNGWGVYEHRDLEEAPLLLSVSTHQNRLLPWEMGEWRLPSDTATTSPPLLRLQVDPHEEHAPQRHWISQCTKREEVLSGVRAASLQDIELVVRGGLYVRDVQEFSPWEAAGFERGMRIVAVNKRRGDPKVLQQQLAAAVKTQSFEVTVISPWVWAITSADLDTSPCGRIVRKVRRNRTFDVAVSPATGLSWKVKVGGDIRGMRVGALLTECAQHPDIAGTALKPWWFCRNGELLYDGKVVDMAGGYGCGDIITIRHDKMNRTISFEVNGRRIAPKFSTIPTTSVQPVVHLEQAGGWAEIAPWHVPAAAHFWHQGRRAESIEFLDGGATARLSQSNGVGACIGRTVFRPGGVHAFSMKMSGAHIRDCMVGVASPGFPLDNKCQRDNGMFSLAIRPDGSIFGPQVKKLLLPAPKKSFNPGDTITFVLDLGPMGTITILKNNEYVVHTSIIPGFAKVRGPLSPYCVLMNVDARCTLSMYLLNEADTVPGVGVPPTVVIRKCASGPSDYGSAPSQQPAVPLRVPGAGSGTGSVGASAIPSVEGIYKPALPTYIRSDGAFHIHYWHGRWCIADPVDKPFAWSDRCDGKVPLGTESLPFTVVNRAGPVSRWLCLFTPAAQPEFLKLTSDVVPSKVARREDIVYETVAGTPGVHRYRLWWAAKVRRWVVTFVKVDANGESRSEKSNGRNWDRKERYALYASMEPALLPQHVTSWLTGRGKEGWVRDERIAVTSGGDDASPNDQAAIASASVVSPMVPNAVDSGSRPERGFRREHGAVSRVRRHSPNAPRHGQDDSLAPLLTHDELAGLHVVRGSVVTQCTSGEFRAALHDVAAQFTGVPELFVTSGPPGDTIDEIKSNAERHMACASTLLRTLRHPNAPDALVSDNFYADAVFGAVQSKSLSMNVVDISRLSLVDRKAFFFSLFKKEIRPHQVLWCFPPPPAEEVRRFIMLYDMMREGLMVVYGMQQLPADMQEDVRRAAEHSRPGKHLIALLTASVSSHAAVDTVDSSTCDVRWRRSAHQRIAALGRPASITYFDQPPGSGKSFSIDCHLRSSRFGWPQHHVWLDLDSSKTLTDVVHALLEPMQRRAGALIVHVAHDTDPVLLNTVLDGLVFFGVLSAPSGLTLTLNMMEWHVVIEFQALGDASAGTQSSWAEEGVMVLACRELAEQGSLIAFDINVLSGVEQALAFMRAAVPGRSLVTNNGLALRMLVGGLSKYPGEDSWDTLSPAEQRVARDVSARTLVRAARYLSSGYTTFCTSQGFGEKELQLLVALSLHAGVKTYLHPSAPDHFHLITTDTVRTVAVQLAGEASPEIKEALKQYHGRIRHSSSSLADGHLSHASPLKRSRAGEQKSLSFLIHVLSEQLAIGIRACTNLVAKENYILTGVFLRKLLQVHDHVRLQDPIVLHGPSGTGKTHAVRVLCKLFDLPLVKRGVRGGGGMEPRHGSIDMQQALLHFCRRDLRVRSLFPNNESDQIGESKGVLWQAEFRPPHAKCLDCLAVLHRGRHRRAIRLVLEEMHNLLGPITCDPRSYPEIAELREANPQFSASLAFVLRCGNAKQAQQTSMTSVEAIETVLTELSNRLLSTEIVAGLETLLGGAAIRQCTGGDFVEVRGILERNTAREAILEWAQDIPRRLGGNFPALVRLIRAHMRATLRSNPVDDPDPELLRLLAGGRDDASEIDSTSLRRLLSLYLDVARPPTHREVLMSYSVTPAALFARVRPLLERALASPQLMFTLVLDEMSATNMLGMIKRLVVDRRWDLWADANPAAGGRIPANVVFIGLVNSSDETRTAPVAGAKTVRHAARFVGADGPAAQRVNEFNVGVLPRSLQAYQVEWPPMAAEQSHMLITCIIAANRTLFCHHVPKSIVSAMERMFVLAHTTVQQLADTTHCTVSQRHIHRTMKVFEFFFERGETFIAGVQRNTSVNELALSSMVLGIAVSYYFGLLPHDRILLDVELSQILSDASTMVKALARPDGTTVGFADILSTAVRSFCGLHLRLPTGVYPHKALLENLFVQIVCFELRMAVILQGPPGTSKTLSNTILRSNMNGTGEFWSKLCTIAQVSKYQASAHTTTEDVERKCKEALGIQQQHDSRGYRNKRCLLFIDEAGLVSGMGGQRALKVLHYYLEDADLASVLISNQDLDPAISNRCVKVHMARPGPDELAAMCEQIVCGKSHRLSEKARQILAGSCKAFYKLLGLENDDSEKERYRWWYGMRDLFYMMRCIRKSVVVQRGEGSDDDDVQTRPSLVGGGGLQSSSAVTLPRAAKPFIFDASPPLTPSNAAEAPRSPPLLVNSFRDDLASSRRTDEGLVSPKRSSREGGHEPTAEGDGDGYPATGKQQDSPNHCPIDIPPDVFTHALERNFNGEHSMFEQVVQCFGAYLEDIDCEYAPDALRKHVNGKLDVVLDSLSDRRDHEAVGAQTNNQTWSRFKLIEDETNGDLLKLLCQTRVQPFQDVQVLSVSTMAKSDNLRSVEVVSQVGAAMEAGQTVWLTNTRSIDACLFDLLNQSFVITRTSRGDHAYFAALSIGGALEYKRVHPDFQCIIHVTKKEVEDGAETLPAPFLNRLEKFSLCVSDVLEYALARLPSASTREQVTALRERLMKFATQLPLAGVATASLPDTCDSLILESIQGGEVSRVYVSERLTAEPSLRLFLRPADETLAIWRSMACRILQLVLPESMLIAQDLFAAGSSAYLWAYFRNLQPWSLTGLFRHVVRRAETPAVASKRVFPRWARMAVYTPMNIDHAGLLHTIPGCSFLCADELLSSDCGIDDLTEAVLHFASNPNLSVFVVVLSPESYTRPECQEIQYALSAHPLPDARINGFKTVVVMQTYTVSPDVRPPVRPLFGVGWDPVFIDAGAENFGVSLLDFVNVEGIGGLSVRPTPEWRLALEVLPQALNALLQAQDGQHRWKRVDGIHDKAAALYHHSAAFEKQVRIAKCLFDMLPKLRKVALLLCTKLQPNLATLAAEVTDAWCADRDRDGARSLGERLLREEQKIPTLILTRALWLLLDRRAASALCRWSEDATAATRIAFADAVFATAMDTACADFAGQRARSRTADVKLCVPASLPTFPASYVLRSLLPDLPSTGALQPSTVDETERACPPAVRGLLHTFATDDDLLTSFFEDTLREFVTHDDQRACDITTKWTTQIAKRHHGYVLPGTKESVCSIHCLAHYERAAVVNFVAAIWPLAALGILEHAMIDATLDSALPRGASGRAHTLVKSMGEIVYDALCQAIPSMATTAPNQVLACIATVVRQDSLRLTVQPHLHAALRVAQRVLRDDLMPVRELVSFMGSVRSTGVVQAEGLAVICDAVTDQSVGPVLLEGLKSPGIASQAGLVRVVIDRLGRIPREMACQVLTVLLRHDHTPSVSSQRNGAYDLPGIPGYASDTSSQSGASAADDYSPRRHRRTMDVITPNSSSSVYNRPRAPTAASLSSSGVSFPPTGALDSISATSHSQRPWRSGLTSPAKVRGGASAASIAVSTPRQNAGERGPVAPLQYERLRGQVHRQEAFFPSLDAVLYRAALCRDRLDPQAPVVNVSSTLQVHRIMMGQASIVNAGMTGVQRVFTPPPLCETLEDAANAEDGNLLRSPLYVALFDVTYAILIECATTAPEARLVWLSGLVLRQRQVLDSLVVGGMGNYLLVQARAGEEAFLQQLAVVFAASFGYGEGQISAFDTPMVQAALSQITAIAKSLLEPPDFSALQSEAQIPHEYYSNNMCLLAAVESQLAEHGVRKSIQDVADAPVMKTLTKICGEALKVLLSKARRVVTTKDFPFVYAGTDLLHQAYQIVKTELQSSHECPSFVDQTMSALVGKVRMLLNGDRMALPVESVRLVLYHTAIQEFFRERRTHRHVEQICADRFGIPALLELTQNQVVALRFALDPTALTRHAANQVPSGCDCVAALQDARDEYGWREVVFRVWAAGAALSNSFLGTLMLNLKPLHHHYLPGDRSGRTVTYGGSYKFDCVSQVGAWGNLENCTRGQPVMSKGACFMLWGLEFTALTLQMLFFPQQIDDVMRWMFSPTLLARVYDYQREVSDHHHLLNQLTERSRAYMFHLSLSDGMTVERMQMLLFSFVYAITNRETRLHAEFSVPTYKTKDAALKVESAVEEFWAAFHNDSSGNAKKTRSSLQLLLDTWRVRGARKLQQIPMEVVLGRLPSVPGSRKWSLLESVICDADALQLTAPLIIDMVSFHHTVHRVLSGRLQQSGGLDLMPNVIELIAKHADRATAAAARATLLRIKTTWNKFRVLVGSLDYECQSGAVDFMMREECGGGGAAPPQDCMVMSVASNPLTPSPQHMQQANTAYAVEETLGFWIVSHDSAVGENGQSNLLPAILNSLLDRYNRLQDVFAHYAHERAHDVDLTHPPPGLELLTLSEHSDIATVVNSYADHRMLTPRWSAVQDELALQYSGLLPRLIAPSFVEFEFKSLALEVDLKEMEEAALAVLKNYPRTDTALLAAEATLLAAAAELTEQQVACCIKGLLEVIKGRGTGDGQPLPAALRATEAFTACERELGATFVDGCVKPIAAAAAEGDAEGDGAGLSQGQAREVLQVFMGKAERCDWVLMDLEEAYRQAPPEAVCGMIDGCIEQYAASAGVDGTKEELAVLVDSLCETLQNPAYLHPDRDLLEFLAAVTTQGEGTLLDRVREALAGGAVAAAPNEATAAGTGAAPALVMSHITFVLAYFKRALFRLCRGNAVGTWVEEGDASPAHAVYRLPRRALRTLGCDGQSIITDLGEEAVSAGLAVGMRLLRVDRTPITAPDALRALAEPVRSARSSEPVDVVVAVVPLEQLNAAGGDHDLAVSLSMRQSLDSLPQSVSFPIKTHTTTAPEPGCVFRDEERLLQKKALLLERIKGLREDITVKERDLDLCHDQMRLHKARLAGYQASGN